MRLNLATKLVAAVLLSGRRPIEILSANLENVQVVFVDVVVHQQFNIQSRALLLDLLLYLWRFEKASNLSPLLRTC